MENESESLTVADLDALIIKYFDTIQGEKKKAEDALTAVNISIQGMESRLVSALKALNRRDYKHPRGTVRIDNQWRVNLPANDLDKSLLFDWLKKKGIYDRMATINSTSLNSLWRQEREAAIKEDPAAAVTFNLPGLGAPKLFEALRKTKGAGESDE